MAAIHRLRRSSFKAAGANTLAAARARDDVRVRQRHGRLLDFFAMRRGGREIRRELVRIIEVLRGRARLRAHLCAPWTTRGQAWILRSTRPRTSPRSKHGLFIPATWACSRTASMTSSRSSTERRPAWTRRPCSSSHRTHDEASSVRAIVPDRSPSRRDTAWWDEWSTKLAGRTVVLALRSCVGNHAQGTDLRADRRDHRRPTTSLPEDVGAGATGTTFSWMRLVFTVRALVNSGASRKPTVSASSSAAPRARR